MKAYLSPLQGNNPVARQTVYSNSLDIKERKDARNSEDHQVARQTVYSKTTPCAKDEGITSVVPSQTDIKPRRDVGDSAPQVARQTVYSKTTPCAIEAVPSPSVGMEVISLATSSVGKIISVSQKLSEVLVQFVDQVLPYQLSGFWDEVELVF